ncbi:MAG TPA: class I SAM-dependent methyltransferase [Gaiellaceae bacterium]|nr:class I SAM-dependent methyltransferase [Gaiellaceae bacterium]
MAPRLRSARNATLRALDRMSLLAPVYRAYERARAVRASERWEDAGDLPVPPSRLRVEVAGTPGIEWFLESGRQQAEIIRSAAERNAGPLEELGLMLDFGCGCGRVLRHWAGLGGSEIHGSDYNERLVGWCAANLPFVTASVNRLDPPTGYEDGQFDLVYAISVFTHLPHDLERGWIDELSRITAPGGLLLLTTHGDAYADRLDADERARYDSGEPVVRWPGVAGSNLCTTFHPEPYVRAHLAPGLELLELAPDGGTVGSRRQDLVVFRKPAPGTAARS